MIEIKGFTLEELRDVLEELVDCDGLFTALVIYNRKLADGLEQGDYAFKTTRGSYRRTERTKELLETVEMILNGD